jgi:hypothetical protein
METKEQEEARNKARVAQVHRIQNGDYTTPEHAHMKKLIALEDRIAKYKRVAGSMSIDNPNAINEVDWDLLNADQALVTDLRRKCSAMVEKIISDFDLQNMNRMWHQYRITGNMNDIYHTE